jgi:hypothetical protein
VTSVGQNYLRGLQILGSEISHTVKREFRTKRQYIIQFKINYPKSKASEIAEKIGTSVGYVHNVLSRYNKIVNSERQGSTRSNGRVCAHGLDFYEDEVPPSWYDSLAAPVVSSRTGMKQIGFKDKGDPCTCQVHRNGHVIVFPRNIDWKAWLIEELTLNGWDKDQSQMLIQNLNYKLKIAEGGVKVPNGYLPKDLVLKTDWGIVVVKDDSPSNNTLELKIDVPNLNKFLGLPEIRHQLRMLTQGTMTNNQLMRTYVALNHSIVNQINRLLNRSDINSSSKS